MEQRIRAVKSTFGMLLTGVQLVIAFHFLTIYIGESKITKKLSDIFLFNNQTTSFISQNNLDEPFNFLLIVLAFGIFTFILFTVVPKIVEKEERRLRTDYK